MASEAPAPDVFQWSFLHPRYWPTWLGYLLLLGITYLPHRVRMKIGRALGALAFYVAKSRRHVVLCNLKVCFPELNDVERDALALDVFKSGGMSIIETAIGWFRGTQVAESRTTLHGVERLLQPQSEGKGVILLGMHMSTLDFAGAALASKVTLDVMYRQSPNKVIEYIMTKGRKSNYPDAIERNDIRKVLKHLKEGRIVWYGPDQDYGTRNAVFAPFFGEDAATLISISRIAKITNAIVVPFCHFRRNNGESYEVFMYEPWPDFPSGSEIDDATRINEFVEWAIRQAPEQYWWFHRRFKNRRPGAPEIY